jgi:cell division septum initiation protein DivIVA
VDVLALSDELDELVSGAKSIPLSEQVRVEREEVFELLDAIRAAIPEEVKQARWIVRERQELLTGARRECERLFAEAHEQAAREASAAAVARIAERKAAELLAEARGQAREIRLEMDDWADGILATLELNLERFLQAVQRGREQLHERSSTESALTPSAR